MYLDRVVGTSFLRRKCLSQTLSEDKEVTRGTLEGSIPGLGATDAKSMRRAPAWLASEAELVW